MKKVVLLLIMALALTGIVEAQTRKKSSSGKRKAQTSSVLPVTKGEVKQYGDYLTTQIFTVKKGKENEVKVEYPIAGNPVLVDSIRVNIKNNVNPQFTGSLATPDALLRSALKGKRDVSFGQEGESLSQEMLVVYSNPNIITFSDEGYSYYGGAHGMPWVSGNTILVSDGSLLTIDMMPSFYKMKSYIRKGLAKSWDIRESELSNYIDNPDGPEDYPGTVYITDKGLVFIYQPYKIAPYAAGAPTAVVPLTQEVINLLPPAAQRFVKK